LIQNKIERNLNIPKDKELHSEGKVVDIFRIGLIEVSFCLL